MVDGQGSNKTGPSVRSLERKVSPVVLVCDGNLETDNGAAHDITRHHAPRRLKPPDGTARNSQKVVLFMLNHGKEARCSSALEISRPVNAAVVERRSNGGGTLLHGVCFELVGGEIAIRGMRPFQPALWGLGFRALAPRPCRSFSSAPHARIPESTVSFERICLDVHVLCTW